MICLFGGTFDPVHLGHLHAARAVCEALPVPADRVVLSTRPGHRDEPGASTSHRWRMLELACAGDARLQPDDLEVRRAKRLGRSSYTVETLEAVRAADPEAVIVWVVGRDAYAGLMTWHRWRDLFALANLLVLDRPGVSPPLPPELDRETRERRLSGVPESPAGGVLLLPAPMQDVSATRIRRALRGADGLQPGIAADLLPAAVYTYIKEHHLYGVVSDA